MERLRIRVKGHPEGDLIVIGLHSSGIAVRFEKREGAFLLNVEDLRAVLAKAEQSPEVK